MISKETLVKIAKLFGVRPWQQERHYIQFLVLTTLADEPIVLKGGTYLWLFYNLQRFSEDLDFTATSTLSKKITEIVSESLGFYGVENVIKIITNNDITFSFRVAAKGPLNTSEKDLCYVYVEISKREPIFLKPIPIATKTEPYGLPVKILSGMDLSEVAAEKIRAIYTRDKARDVYDLWFLLKKGYLPDANIFKKKLAYYEMNFSSELFTIKLKQKEAIWQKELKPLIFEKLPEYKEVFDFIITSLRLI